MISWLAFLENPYPWTIFCPLDVYANCKFSHQSLEKSTVETHRNCSVEVITVPHIVQPESSRLLVDYHQTTMGKLYDFSYNFLVAVQWLSHQTISPMDFPMDCLVNRHWTYAWKGQELIIVLYIIINKQLITPPSEFCILVKQQVCHMTGWKYTHWVLPSFLSHPTTLTSDDHRWWM